MVIPKVTDKSSRCIKMIRTLQNTKKILSRAKDVLMWVSLQSNILIMKKALLQFRLVKIKMF